jgi:uncharacterized protein YpuA (DUF1002 family)
MWKKLTALLLTLTMVLALCVPAFATGAETDEWKGYLVLGDGLSDSQKSTVLQLMGVDESDLDSYYVTTTTHEEEVDLFGDYLSASVLGSKAMSSILLIPQAEGSGIDITLHNINYCTEEMYQSALIDAGVSDVKVIVAGPVELSGTCALASAMKAYSLMTGEDIDDAAVDAAVNEIVATGTVADEVGDSEDATELIAALKQTVLSEDLDETGIGEALDKLCQQMGVTLSSETRAAIIELMLKLKDCDIDVSALEQQAADLYNRVKAQLDAAGFTEGLSDNAKGFLAKLIDALKEFFTSLFG